MIIKPLIKHIKPIIKNISADIPENTSLTESRGVFLTFLDKKYPIIKQIIPTIIFFIILIKFNKYIVLRTFTVLQPISCVFSYLY